MPARGVTLERATEAHARELAPRIRREDALEVLASSRQSPLEALLEGLEVSAPAYAVRFDGELGLLGGVAPGRPGVGHPWMLTSDLVERHRVAFVQVVRDCLDAWLERFPVLENAVDARYERALRWARRAGFQVDPPAPFGAEGLPFCRITLRRLPHV